MNAINYLELKTKGLVSLIKEGDKVYKVVKNYHPTETGVLVEAGRELIDEVTIEARKEAVKLDLKDKIAQLKKELEDELEGLKQLSKDIKEALN